MNKQKAKQLFRQELEKSEEKEVEEEKAGRCTPPRASRGDDSDGIYSKEEYN